MEKRFISSTIVDRNEALASSTYAVEEEALASSTYTYNFASFF